jgi:hypothetical protein
MLPGWLTGCLAGCLAGYLAASLAGCMFGWLTVLLRSVKVNIWVQKLPDQDLAEKCNNDDEKEVFS